MNEQKLINLIQMSESPALDFKRDLYDFSGTSQEHKYKNRTAFVKDILAFANTPRDGSAYIIIGVKKNEDGSKEKAGLDKHVDDNILQQQLEDWVYPHPKFCYHEISHDSKQFGVIEICCDQTISGPFYPTTKSKGEGALRPNVLYFRRGSKNVEADPNEVKSIVGWFLNGDATNCRLHADEPLWDSFISASHLGQRGIRYVLFLGLKEIPSQEHAKALGNIDWGFVADFDPDSSISGVFNAVKPILEKRKSVHTLTNGDAHGSSQPKGATWYLARGINGRASSMVGSSWQEWLKKCASDFRTRLVSYAASSVEPVVAIALWDDLTMEQHLRRCFESSTEAFGDAVTLLLLTTEDDALKRTAIDCGAEIIPLGTNNFLDGLSSYAATQASDADSLVLCPGVGGVQKCIEAKDVAWLEEDLELIHINVGRKPEQVGQLGVEFLRGGGISWFELGVGCDIERDETRKILNAVRHDLETRMSSRVNLFHKPGAGGTTISKRIAWTLRSDFPCVALKRCDPKGSVERIAWIYQRTEKPVLIIREGSDIDDTNADDLARQLAARHVPSVILQVLRRHTLPKQGKRSFTLESALNSSEVGRFIEVLAREAPDSRQKLEELGRADSNLQTPFIFGLTAFQNDFRGIQPFVENHLIDITDVQSKILLLLALAHKYGHKSISKENFADLLGLPQSRPVDFQQALSSAALGLLVESERGFWRTSHELIATELITQILSKDMQDKRNWKLQLTDAAIFLGDFCNPARPVQPEDLASIADRVFLFRDDADPLGTVNLGGSQFSSLACDLPSPESRLRLFQHLAETFFNKPHYWAHLGRFYSVELHRFEDALSAIDRAIQLDGNDSLLHHMKGMVLRNALIGAISDKSRIEQVVQLGKEASECFEEARNRSPDDLYGYISEVQMLIRALDYLSITTKKSTIHSAAESEEPWLREAFQRIEDLLAAVRRLRRGERPSEYEERCRADLDRLYGAHDEALQRWQNLLDRKNGAGISEIFAPPIRRQIVWTYLARVGRQWKKLSAKDIKRSMELLEKNIAEEPGDDRNTRMWLHGSRYLNPSPSLDTVLERVAYWKSQCDSIDASYYLYVLYTLQALSGSSLSAERAMREIEETRGRARYRRDRSYSSEWFGDGDGLSQLVPQDELGGWSDEKGFWEHEEKLTRIKGIITSIAGPQAGEIEFEPGIKAFFVPGTCGITKARDENSFVTCFLGFSFDGPRAWSVRRIEPE